MDAILKRFIDKVDMSGDCHLWTAGKDKYGYGAFSIKGKSIKAHRYIWEHYNGPIPEGLCILHKCDVRDCVNPDHLSVGTNLENILDMRNKGRANYGRGNRHRSVTHPETIAKGEDSKASKLTLKDVIEIRKTYVHGTRGIRSEFSLTGLAEKYGVRIQTIHDVVKNVTWKHAL